VQAVSQVAQLLQPVTHLTASILQQILEGLREQRRWTNFTSPHQQRAIRHLLAADLIEDNVATLRPTNQTLAAFALTGGLNGFCHHQRIALDHDG